MNEPIRVLQIVSYMDRGGTETLLMNLYRNIDRTKIQFDFLVHNLKEQCFDKEIEALGGKIYRIPRFSPWRFDKQFKEYDKFFKAHPEYKIVHSHIDLNNLGTLRAAYKAGTPTRICHLHCANLSGKNIPFSYRCKKMVLPLISRYLTHRFACSRLSALEGYGRYGDDAIILNNGIQTEKFRFIASDRIKKRNELGWDDKFVVLSVANFVEPKNHRFLIEVFNETLKQRKEALLALAGAGPLQPQIEAQIKELGIGANVQFLGVRNDVPDLLKAADVFLFPSLYEGFGIVAEEAQASGLPVVASDVLPEETRLTDLIRYVSLSDSPQRWAQIVLEEANRERNARETYAEVVKNAGFDISASVEMLTKFYLNAWSR